MTETTKLTHLQQLEKQLAAINENLESGVTAAWARGKASGRLDGLAEAQRIVLGAAATAWLGNQGHADLLKNLARNDLGQQVQVASKNQAAVEQLEKPREEALYRAVSGEPEPADEAEPEPPSDGP